MVLVRTELGQLVMVPQQALAQAQAQNNLSPRPTTPTTGPSFRATGPQVGPAAGPLLLQYLHLVQFNSIQLYLYSP